MGLQIPPDAGGAPYCVICLMVLGRRAIPAVTTTSGNSVCADHVWLRVHSGDLRAAIRVANEDLEPRAHH